jgi:hypothetical protein
MAATAGYQRRDFKLWVETREGPEPVWVRIHSLGERHVAIADKMPQARRAATVSEFAAEIAQHVQDVLLGGGEMVFLEHYHRDVSPVAGQERLNRVTFQRVEGRLKVTHRAPVALEQAAEVVRAALQGAPAPPPPAPVSLHDADPPTGARPRATSTPPPPARPKVPAFFNDGAPDRGGGALELEGPVEAFVPSEVEEAWASEVAAEVPYAAALGE